MYQISSQRRTRVYLACVNCRGRKIKCLTDDSEETPCKRCVRMGLVCQYIPVPVQQANSAPAPPIGRPRSFTQPASSPAASRPGSAAGNQQATHERHPQSFPQNSNTMGYTPLDTFDRSVHQFGGPYHTTPAVPAQQQYPQGLAPALTPPFEGHQVPQGYTTMAPNYTVPGPSVQQRGQQPAPDGSGYHRSSTQQQYVAPISNAALHTEIQLASAYTPDHAIAPGAGDESS
ncbi:hypothetical protein B0H14DRAFT_2611797 [Mycena olivaceomarginata]|nr:hypothetical protein B0H14DRAFT_2611797 [Mycena olivaceomarginata]